jgi:LysM repeat protein
VVREGDTLWSIAETLAPGQDPRPVVDRLASVNGLDPALLVPGQTLVVPSSV